MRIHLLSDLHLEFGPAEIPQAEADLVILAGDLHTKCHGIPWIKATFPDQPVIYITGNHEFYGEKHPRLIGKLKEEAAGTRIHVLEDESVEIGGFFFFGCTLWSDLELLEDSWSGAQAALEMNDYRRIRDSRTYRKLRPVDTRGKHLLSLQKLETFLTSRDPRKSVVVTHHAPSIRSLPPGRQTDPVSCAYASHLDDFVLRTRPLLWVHGHIHHIQDYRIGETRIVANPRGYPDLPVEGFNPSRVLEV